MMTRRRLAQYALIAVTALLVTCSYLAGTTRSSLLSSGPAFTNAPPYYVNFSWTPGIGDTATPITFTARVFDYEDPPDAIQVRWDWETDGTWDTAWHLNKNAEHLFPDPGIYDVTLEAMDTGGLTGNRTHPVMVRLPPPPPPPPLHVQVSANPTAGTMPLTVSFASEVSGGVPPYQETRVYVRRVMDLYRQYSAVE